ncbi:MAG TPA: spore maturation protein [Firmicutes bacterium]|nr:spore maturation protein [Bacillota bacterium]
MINIIWFLLIAIGIIYSFLSGNNNIGNIIVNSSYDTYKLLISIGPLVVLWSGIMNIASKSGLLTKFSKLLNPILKKIMPSIKNNKALEYISSNIAANMLGLGSVATPAGLKAMKELSKENNQKDEASDAMITFLVLNTSGVTIIPMTVIALRNSYGSINPTSIIIPSIIATTISSICGLTLDYIIRRKNAK